MERSALRAGAEQLTVHLVEDRRATVSPWGLGNPKLGRHVYTYSLLPGRVGGTCPGSTWACESVCYAKRLVLQNNEVAALYRRNTQAADRGRDLASLPADATLVRIHVSGDFDSVEYVDEWTALAAARPEVTFFGYTRSWRVPEMRSALEALRDMPNVQLFASVDSDLDGQETRYLEDAGWRRSLLVGDLDYTSEGLTRTAGDAFRLPGGGFALVCPEETGRRASCEDCGFCFRGQRGDVVFPEH